MTLLPELALGDAIAWFSIGGTTVAWICCGAEWMSRRVCGWIQRRADRKAAAKRRPDAFTETATTWTVTSTWREHEPILWFGVDGKSYWLPCECIECEAKKTSALAEFCAMLGPREVAES